MLVDTSAQEEPKPENSIFPREVIPFAQFSTGQMRESIPEGVRRSAAALVRDALKPTVAPSADTYARRTSSWRSVR